MKPIRENVVLLRGESISAFEFRGHEFDCPYHFHPEFEITMILAGEGQRLAGDGSGCFSPGEIYMFGGGLPHMFRNWAPSLAHSRYIQFRREAMGEGFFDLPEMGGIGKLLRDSTRGICFSADTLKKARKEISSLYAATGPERLAAFLRLLQTLSVDPGPQFLASAHYRNDPVTNEQVCRVVELIEERWDRQVSAVEIARSVGIHPRSLTRLFQRALGKNFRRFLVDLRLNRAARALLETDRPISEVAFACGFNNLSNFNRLFRIHHGCSPRKYRRRRR